MTTDERRTRMKLSADARELWEETERVYASPVAMRRPEAFAVLRRKLARLPANQQRYYRRLVRLNAERFYRAALLRLEPEELAEMVEEATGEDLALIAAPPLWARKGYPGIFFAGDARLEKDN